MKKQQTLTNEEMDFIEQSNLIEGVGDPHSFEDAAQAWIYLRKQKVLSTDVVLKVHKMLMKRQPLDKKDVGHYRQHDVQVGSRVCINHALVSMEMQMWLFESIRHTPPPDWRELHIRYEHIHPFADGNGRTGRMFMNFMRIKQELPVLIIWDHEKKSYYDWF